MSLIFENRQQAGLLLAKKLVKKKIKDGQILAIPRGGVVTGQEISQKIGLPLNVLVVKKIGAPYDPELAIGAVAPEGIVFWDEILCQRLKINNKERKDLLEKAVWQQKEKEKSLKVKSLSLKDKKIILVDDGIATGATVLAALKYLKKKKADQIILAVPVISQDALARIIPEVKEIIYLESPSDFWAVGQFYHDFPPVEDEEVITILKSKKKNAK